LIIESKRLVIRSLSYKELVKYSEGKNPFTGINVTFAKNEIEEPLRPVIQNKVIPNVKNETKNVLFYTLWLVVEKRFNGSVGSIMFKGPPDAEGKVEIGYGIHEEFQNRGYMTEAISAFCKWAFEKGGVKIITAETAKDNHASFSVLEKNGFTKFDENDEFYYWKLEK
jgi:predicted acetyltransferase